jgi:carboxymethylenebutenolidase
VTSRGAAAYLRGLTSSNGKVGVIGYCSGGRQAFLAACSLSLDAAVDCYGAFVVGDPPAGLSLRMTPLLHLADRLSCPLLGVVLGGPAGLPAAGRDRRLAAHLRLVRHVSP